MDVILGVGVAFEIPVLIFSLILFRIATPRFLLRHSRYAILIIFTLAAVLTPTTDMGNMLMVAVPMCLLFYAGILGGCLLSVRRDGRRIPWRKAGIAGGLLLLAAAGALYLAITRFGLGIVPHWPFFR